MDRTTAEEQKAAIGTCWVHVWKGDKVKSRLVVQGYAQHIDDLDTTFASTPSLVTLKLLLTLSIVYSFVVRAGDISTAFLHAFMPEFERYFVWPPKEYYPLGGVLWRLRRALYGLRNSPKLWQDHFASVMLTLGFQRLKADPNFYVKHSSRLYVLCYVDDLLVVGPPKEADWFMQTLAQHVLLKDTGTLSETQSITFLG